MHFFVAILIPILAALWVFMDARQKGRTEGQSLLWAFGTFMALIIFLPLWLFVRWQEGQTKQTKNVYVCPYCHYSFKNIERARYCPYCGQALSDSEHSDSIDIQCQEDVDKVNHSSGESSQN